MSLARPEGFEAPSRGEPGAADRFDAALQERIEGKASLADVEVDVFWLGDTMVTTARVFGGGVGIWQRRLQFRLSKAQVLGILGAIQKARFGSMPDQFGESAAGGKDESLRLKGRLVVRAGAVQKSTLQLVNGQQSKAFAGLVERVLAICAEPARKGIGASSMTDALQKLASGRLSPEVLEVAAQRRPDPKGPGAPDHGWMLRLNGLLVSDERIDPAGPPTPARTLTLSEKEFHELAALLSEAAPSTLPQSLYAASYTDLTIAVFRYSRTITGRRFLGMKPETHGDRQKAFDRICAALVALHERVEEQGAAPHAGADSSR